MSDLTTSIEVPTVPWEAAKARFLERLTDEQKALFNGASAENVFYSASAAFKGKESTSKMRSIQRRMKPFTDALENHGKALDVLANVSSTFISPVWGGVRVVLALAKSYGKYYDDLIDMFARIGDILPSLQLYEHLFRNHERVLSALAATYLDLLEFCDQTKQVFQDTKSVDSPSKKNWKHFKGYFQDYISAFKRHQDTVMRAAMDAHMIEAMKTQEIVLSDRTLKQREQIADRRTKLLDRLSSLDYRAQHRALQRDRVEGTGTWFTEDQAFRDWLDDEQSAHFACYGIPGSGKTMLASTVIDKMSPFFSSLKSAICYHYCDYRLHPSLTAAVIFGTLSRQLLDRIEIPNSVSNSVSSLSSCYEIASEDMYSIWLACLKCFSQVFVVIDGLDELDSSTQNVVLAQLRGTKMENTLKLKILYFSRNEDLKILRAFEDVPALSITPQNVAGDLRKFVETCLDAEGGPSHVITLDSNVRRAVLDELCMTAADMFILAKFQIRELCEAITAQDVLEILQDIPKDMSSMLLRIVMKRWSSGDGRRKLEKARRVFEWIATAYRPLTLDELCEAVAIDKTDTSLKWDKVASDGLQLLDACGSLVKFDPVTKTVSLAHRIVLQWLCSASKLAKSSGSLNETQALSTIAIDELCLAREMAQRCVAYLAFSDFERQVVQHKAIQVNAPASALKTAVWSKVPQSTHLQTLARLTGLQRHSSTLNIDLAAGKLVKPQADDLETKFRLLAYIAAHWHVYLAALGLLVVRDESMTSFLDSEYATGEADGKTFRKRLQRIVNRPHPGRNVNPWLSQNKPGTSTKQALAIWSAEHDVAILLEFILGEPSHDIGPVWDGPSLFESASRHRSWNVVQYLVTQPRYSQHFLDDLERYLFDIAVGIPNNVLTACLYYARNAPGSQRVQALRVAERILRSFTWESIHQKDHLMRSATIAVLSPAAFSWYNLTEALILCEFSSTSFTKTYADDASILRLLTDFDTTLSSTIYRSLGPLEQAESQQCAIIKDFSSSDDPSPALRHVWGLVPTERVRNLSSVAGKVITGDKVPFAIQNILNVHSVLQRVSGGDGGVTLWDIATSFLTTAPKGILEKIKRELSTRSLVMAYDIYLSGPVITFLAGDPESLPALRELCDRQVAPLLHDSAIMANQDLENVITASSRRASTVWPGLIRAPYWSELCDNEGRTSLEVAVRGGPDGPDLEVLRFLTDTSYDVLVFRWQNRQILAALQSIPETYAFEYSSYRNKPPYPGKTVHETLHDAFDILHDFYFDGTRFNGETSQLDPEKVLQIERVRELLWEVDFDRRGRIMTFGE